MKTLSFRKIRWTAAKVSWLGLLMMSVVVAGVGMTGTGHVIDYLHERMVAHGLGHNREIAEGMVSQLQPVIEEVGLHHGATLQGALEHFRPLGYRIFVVDRIKRRLVADSHGDGSVPLPLKESWLAGATSIRGGEVPASLAGGAWLKTDRISSTTLIWFEPVAAPGTEEDRWLVGVASDQNTLVQFLGDLHWHLDAVLLATYLLIAVLGYFALRGVGRIYERDLEARLRERTRELETAHQEVVRKTRLATIGQTASVLTHEMRNPLASIKLALAGLRDSGSVPGRERRRVSLVLGEVDRLDGLLSETLDYVRPLQLSKERVDLDGLVERVVNQQQPLLRERRVGVRHLPCEGCPTLLLDESKMHQVVLNLLKNAVEASPPGDEITIRHRHADGETMLEVCNQGEPVDPKTLDRVFEPFYTTKPKGSGLGLVLVRRVVEEHGGRVVLTSDAQSGTRITLHLPV